jgi:hypothetical protein
MGEITVKGLGTVRIKGDVPDEAETNAIREMMAVPKTPTIPVSDPTPAERLVTGLHPDTLTADPRPMLESKTGFTRGTAQGIGATALGVAGEALGPMGVVGGAATGAAGGSLAYDAADAALRYATGAGQRGPMAAAEDPMAPTKRALSAAEEEFKWTGGAVALIPALRSIKPFLLGVHTPAARRLQKVSEQMDIPLGASAVTERGWVKGAGKVLGVFPFVGSPAKHAAVRTEVALRTKYDKILNQLAPNATLADVGVDLTKGAVEKFGKFKAVAGELYDSFFKKASALPVPDIFPTEKAVALASKLTGKVKAGEVILKSGDPLQAPLPKALDDYIEKLMELPDNITAEQYRQLQVDLGDVMSSMKRDGFDISRAVKLKKALELDFNNPDISRLEPEAGKAVIDSLTMANEFYSRNIAVFQSPTAKRFGRVNKKMFEAGAFKPGTIYEDEAFKAIFNSKSPQAVNDLRELVGTSRFGGAVRKFIETEFDKVINPKTNLFDAERFGKALGLGTEGGEQALSNMFKGSPVQMKTMEKFVEMAKRSGMVALPDTSSFIARRLTLGGFQSAVGGLTMGAGMLTNPVIGGATILLVRHGATIISSPAKLKAMTRILDNSVPDQQRRALLLRFGKQLYEEEVATEERQESRMRQPRGNIMPGVQ